MTNEVNPVPEGFHTVTPYLMVPDADVLVRFLERAFGAVETFRATGSAGGAHVEMKLGNSMVMLGGLPGQEAQPASIFLYLEGVDEVYQRALEAGATPIEEPAEQPQDADRRAGVADQFGNSWFIATQIEDVSREELHKRHDDLA